MKNLKGVEWVNLITISLLTLIILLLSYILFFDKLIKKQPRKELELSKSDIKKMEKELDELDINLDDVLEELDN